jgi:hypothetical protein
MELNKLQRLCLQLLLKVLQEQIMPEQYLQVYVVEHIYKDDFFDLKKVDFLQDFYIFEYVYQLAL